MDDDDRYIPRWGPMFSRGTAARAELATDLAIPLLAEGGWQAVTLRSVARAANVTPQAIAAWFPSVAVMRVAIAECYGRRWMSERRAVAHRRMLKATADAEDVPLVEPQLRKVAIALLPGTWLEETFDGVWLTVVEAGRWDEAIGASVAAVQEDERDLVTELLDDPEDEGDVDLVLTLVRGLRAARVAQRGDVTSRSAGRTSAR